ncbi:nagb/rpia/CoA transferase-like protein [Venturia nashicola]|uniref:Translation initiation factor eIF2B subunit beta n=1 Tax=Venturia nashicola TaxID=86259 RepID=A0A4Z1NRD3_9PEZI|nr:nagb/rpia/CoA transferase-like protein [Venturia nashicola]TLD22603.1 nagb/rpia/CoA transferase-like protein [Venturia nashicola]
MPSATVSLTPGLGPYLRSLKESRVESSIEQLISLLKRRQIRNSRPCAMATAELLHHVVDHFHGRDATELIERIRDVGRRLVAAQPREMAVGNIVRRTLGLVREVVGNPDGGDETTMSDADSTACDSPRRPKLSSTISTFSPLAHSATRPVGGAMTPENRDFAHRPPLLTSHTSYAPAGAPTVTSLFGLFSHPATDSNTSTPPNFQSHSPALKSVSFAEKLSHISEFQPELDIKSEVLQGITELLDELDQVDEQIAAYATDHIHSDEIILTHTSSLTTQRFLLNAAKKRKFTVVHVEGYPNDSEATHDTLRNGAKKDAREGDDGEDERFKPLTAAGITVILIPDSAVFAIMSRVNKVILATHSVLANGGLVAASGARVIAQAARAHQTPVVVLSGVYKLSPIYPFAIDELIEFGDSGKMANYEDAEFVDKIDVVNPLYDYVPPELVNLYISNLGGHAPSYLYHVVAEHYSPEDTTL